MKTAITGSGSSTTTRIVPTADDDSDDDEATAAIIQTTVTATNTASLKHQRSRSVPPKRNGSGNAGSGGSGGHKRSEQAAAAAAAAAATTPTTTSTTLTTSQTTTTTKSVVVIQVGRCGCICQYLLVTILLLIAFLIAKVKFDPEDAWGPVPIANATNSLEAFLTDSQRPGLQFARDGYEPHFPVVFVPGIISTALEVWQGEACARRNFRERIWGSTLMIKSIVFDSRCWLRHMQLNKTTGLDPDGIKLRPSAGLEAADFLVGGYWVWAKIIENAADIGYDPNSMFMAPYDWRLAFRDLERRDAYYSRLKSLIEIARQLNHDRKVVITTHSMGGLVLQYFLQWVESPHGGKGGEHWVNDNVHAIVNIGSPLLGVPKSISALLSGEMRDTAELAPFINFLRHQLIFSNSDVVGMMRSFRSVPSMIPKGGTRIWGTRDSAPDDVDELTVAADVLEDGSAVAPSDVHSVPSSTLASQPTPESTVNLPSKGSIVSFTEPWPHPFQFAEHTETGKRQREAPAAAAATDGTVTTPEADDAALRALRADLKQSIKQALADSNGTTDSDGDTLIAAREAKTEAESPSVNRRGLWHAQQQFNIDETLDLIRTVAPEYMREIDSLYSVGFATADDLTRRRGVTKYDHSRYWANPLESALPDARHLKIYCFYGVGKESERAYVYTNGTASPTGIVPTQNPPPHPPPDGEEYIPHILNTTVNLEAARISHGVSLTNGDATVPLISLGFMSVKGWKHPRFNPSNVTTITREYFDDAAQISLNRQHGGINFLRRVTSSDHVDIMGNFEVISDLLKVIAVAPKHLKSSLDIEQQTLPERIFSRIRAIAERVQMD